MIGEKLICCKLYDWTCRDILKLTALFTARRGRAFLSSLSQREGRNYQFDFLRPTHSLYSLFQRMVQMYTSVLAPPTEALEELEIGSQRTGGRKVALGQAKQRSEWDKWRSERSKAKEEAKEAQRGMLDLL
jgi:splicing factor 3A subunit 1